MTVYRFRIIFFLAYMERAAWIIDDHNEICPGNFLNVCKCLTTVSTTDGSHWWHICVLLRALIQRSYYHTYTKSCGSILHMPIGSGHVISPRNAPLLINQNYGLNAECSPRIQFQIQLSYVYSIPTRIISINISVRDNTLI